jgi:DNA-binding transcriptional ArsR family regulator
MEKEIIKVLMHPIRIKIVQELGLRKQATTKELLSSCGDVSQATMYRHINELLKNEIIIVASENIINGIVEKVYTMNSLEIFNINSNPKQYTPDDFLNMFTQYTIALLNDFYQYMKNEHAMDNIEHNIGFSGNSVLLSDEETVEMMKEIYGSIGSKMSNEPNDERKLRKVSVILTTLLD